MIVVAGSSPRLAQAYEGGWLACRLIAERWGQAALVRFYRAVGTSSLAPREAVAAAMKIPLEGVNVEKVGTADSESFAAYDIPRTTIHSLTQETLPILHTDRDTLKEINDDDYYQSYQLIATYLAVIDARLGQPSSAPPQGSPTGLVSK